MSTVVAVDQKAAECLQRDAPRTFPSIADDVTVDPIESAKQAGLCYTSDARPGFRRKKRGAHFSYIGLDGQPLRDEKTLQRIKALAIPPAWTDVWISPIAHGHLQATGRDARGRKQYRYHTKWRETRDETKYERMLAFGQALPHIRAQVDRDLARPGLPREKVLATAVRLLEMTLIRVGNEEYAKKNKSYGLTTMRARHVDIDGSALRFHFKGKSGVRHDIGIKNRRLANIVRKLRDLPGQHLFQYVDDDGELRDVDSDDVNQYIREISGEGFTAKDFRTWTGTRLAAEALRELQEFDSEAQAKRNIVQAVESVARTLGNTPSVCRKCYIHPEILNAYLDGETIKTLEQRIVGELSDSLADLEPEEVAVMVLLHERLSR
ncbi:MAG: DNA topoisomerase IB [Chloroflexota bacterium]